MSEGRIPIEHRDGRATRHPPEKRWKNIFENASRFISRRDLTSASVLTGTRTLAFPDLRLRNLKRKPGVALLTSRTLFRFPQILMNF